MATAWQIILREISKELNAFAGGNAANVSTAYTTTPLTVAEVVDPYFNLDFIKDKAIDAYSRLALEIANVRQHPWRTFIGNTTTSNIASGAVLPPTASNNKTIVGALGQVSSSSDGQAMTEAAPERVRMFLDLGSTVYLQPYLYYIDGNRIYHTETNVVINVCTYERGDTVTTVAANGSIALPDVLVDAIVAGAVAACIIEAKGMEMGGYFSGMFQKAIDSIRDGQTTFPMRTLPATA